MRKRKMRERKMRNLKFNKLKDHEIYHMIQTEILFAAEIIKNNPSMTRTEVLRIAYNKVRETGGEK